VPAQISRSVASAARRGSIDATATAVAAGAVLAVVVRIT
jgi:hypothetical protein